MIQAVSEGILLGLLLSVFIGPVFFLLMEASIHKGVRPAIYMNLGVFASDLLCVLAAYVFASELLISYFDHVVFYGLGGAVFLAFGLASLFKKKPAQEQSNRTIKSNNKAKLFMQGFLLNAINPSVIIFWSGAMFFASSRFSDSPQQLLFYFIFALATTLGVDFLKLVFARKLKAFLNATLLLRISQATGMALIGFGASLLLKVF